MPGGAGKMCNHQNGVGGLNPFLEGMRLWKIHVKQLLGTFLPKGFYYVEGFFLPLYYMQKCVTIILVYFACTFTEAAWAGGG